MKYHLILNHFYLPVVYLPLLLIGTSLLSLMVIGLEDVSVKVKLKAIWFLDVLLQPWLTAIPMYFFKK